jgi:predicted kinase
MIQYAIFTRGIQGSGKSYWAEQYIKKHQNFKRINRDTFRHMLSNYTYNDINEQLVQKVWEETVRQTLLSGFSIVLDEMNLNDERVNKSIVFIKSIIPDIEIQFKKFEVTLEKAIERDLRRNFSVGEKAIRKTWNKYVLDPVENNCYEFKFANEKNGECFVCDMDKTISLPYPDRDIYDGSKAYLDFSIKPVLRIIHALLDSGEFIIFLSGRAEHDRKVTEEWLLRRSINVGENSYPLFMRKDDDQRPDAIIKKEIYKNQIEPYYNVLAVFDDRKQVLRMWQNELGIFTFDVSQDCDTLNEY